MYTLDFDKPYLGADSKPVTETNTDTREKEELHLGRLLAGLLGRQRKSANKTKLMIWCIALESKEPLKIDKADYTMLRKVIDEDEYGAAFFLGRCLEIMDAAKEE